MENGKLIAFCCMTAHSGFEEAKPRPSLRDLVSGGTLFQVGARILVGRSKIHTCLERWNGRLQDGSVGGHMFSVCFYLLVIISKPKCVRALNT